MSIDTKLFQKSTKEFNRELIIRNNNNVSTVY